MEKKVDVIKRAVEFALPQIGAGIEQLLETGEQISLGIQWVDVTQSEAHPNTFWLMFELTVGEDEILL